MHMWCDVNVKGFWWEKKVFLFDPDLFPPSYFDSFIVQNANPFVEPKKWDRWVEEEEEKNCANGFLFNFIVIFRYLFRWLFQFVRFHHETIVKQIQRSSWTMTTSYESISTKISNFQRSSVGQFFNREKDLFL